MGVQKNAIYKVHNGTDFDEINFKTIAAQVKTSDGDNVENKLVDKASKTLDFLHSTAINGYTKLPNGIIIQWGTRSIDNSGMLTTFPITFPNSCLLCLCNLVDSGTTFTNVWSVTKSNFYVKHFYDGWLNVSWIAVGY